MFFWNEQSFSLSLFFLPSIWRKRWGKISIRIPRSTLFGLQIWVFVVNHIYRKIIFRHDNILLIHFGKTSRTDKPKTPNCFQCEKWIIISQTKFLKFLPNTTHLRCPVFIPTYSHTHPQIKLRGQKLSSQGCYKGQ